MFFWFDTLLSTVRFRQITYELPLKINVGKASHVPLVVEEFRANIVEIGVHSISRKMLDICRKYDIKIMVNHLEKDSEVFRRILDWDVDMVNVDHGDLFARIAHERRECDR